MAAEKMDTLEDKSIWDDADVTKLYKRELPVQLYYINCLDYTGRGHSTYEY